MQAFSPSAPLARTGDSCELASTTKRNRLPAGPQHPFLRNLYWANKDATMYLSGQSQSGFKKKKKKRRFTELSFFRWFALRCILSAPARPIWPWPTQSASLQFCRVMEHSAYSSHKSRRYPGISRKQRRGSGQGGWSRRVSKGEQIC